jgi:hypothetical protein
MEYTVPGRVEAGVKRERLGQRFEDCVVRQRASRNQECQTAEDSPHDRVFSSTGTDTTTILTSPPW